MIKKEVLTGIALLMGVSSQLYAQDGAMTMTLEECLQYAKEHSITLQQAKIDVENYQIDESTAKSAFLPAFSGSVSQGLNNNPFDNTDGAQRSSYSGSYGVDMSMTLYKGGENSLNLKQSKLYTQIGELGIKEIENSLEVSITRLYIEILYATDMIEVVENSLELSRKNIERGEVLRRAGGLNEADFAQLLTAEATENYNLVLAKTSLSSLYVELRQLLEITNETTIRVDTSELISDSLMSAIPSVQEVYSEAMETRPEIAASNLKIETAEYDVRMAKSGFLPTLSLSAGVGVNHGSSSSFGFSDQMRYNYSNSVGLNLSVPIFNRNANRNTLAKSKNASRYASLNHIDESKNLYQTIETLRNNAESAAAMYTVSNTKIEALAKSLALVTKQYEVGAKNIIDLLTEQDDYRTSQQEYLESKYTLILNQAILNFYRTGVIKL